MKQEKHYPHQWLYYATGIIRALHFSHCASNWWRTAGITHLLHMYYIITWVCFGKSKRIQGATPLWEVYGHH